ncbi:hypothetical protein KAR91_26020 [Candidatus Pacearchaeota archaeon]|nr:hypothetical protein [Candidatus Pacearchaeota archaeon]
MIKLINWIKGKLFPGKVKYYGIVRRKSGTVFIKNYGHELENGKGLTRDQAKNAAARAYATGGGRAEG